MSENWKIQVSPKLADGTLINLRAETPDEAARILDWAIENAAKIHSAVQAVNAVSGVAAAFPGPGTQVVQQAPAEQAQGPWSQQGSQQGPPPAFVPQQQAPAAPAGQMCTHGAMVYREAKPGSGKSWKAYFCPTPKDTPGQCQPQFLKG